MKIKSIFNIIASVTFLAVGCGKYDDTSIKSEISSLNSRVSVLETMCNVMNQNVTSLKNLLAILQQNQYITAVRENYSGGELTGYTIMVSDGSSITIINGKDGRDGKNGTTPIIGVRLYNGLYYWTIDGEWMLDSNGNKIPTGGKDGVDGEDGITPQMKITDGCWYVSTDNGKTWQFVGKADGNDGDSMFSDVRQDDNYLYLVLADGTTITVPKMANLRILMDNTSFIAQSNTMAIPFKVEGADSDIQVSGFSSDGINTTFVVQQDGDCRVNVEFTKPDRAGKLLITAYSKGRTAMKILTFEKGVLTSDDDTVFEVEHEGGVINMTVSHNADITFKTDVNWISFVQTKQINTETYYFKVEANKSTSPRIGTIEFSSKATNSTLMFTVQQEQYVVYSSEAEKLAAKAKRIDTNGTANCYIIPSVGLYKFAAVKGNSDESVGDVAYVDVLWETYGTEEEPGVHDIVEEVAYYNGDVIVRTAVTRGNALVTANNSAGEVLWSWHIWCTDVPADHTYANNAGILMDRNLGATSATPGDVRAQGFLYQWGRKDPFLSSGRIKTNVPAASTLTWPKPVSIFSEGVLKDNTMLDYSIKHPTVFITNSSSPNDWYSTSSIKANLWGSKKTAYDPCPAGYRVPSGGIWKVASIGTPDGYDSMHNGIMIPSHIAGQNAWYPAVGEINATEGSIVYNDSGFGFYHVCDDDGVYIHILGFLREKVDLNYTTNRGHGYSVRCQKIQ